ncbi:Hint domain-containing protein [uncultured Mameliella sp.]|uniref:Hint domain-containing protein n=1 Tax=uncultured Mameliella sp. TaxID=1447087 RepID=UPI0026293D3A|nr:Hint domain-containing protein [uncultured Mameliella sp.]
MDRSAFLAGLDSLSAEPVTLNDGAPAPPTPVGGLLAGTRIKTLRGHVRIEDLRRGDKILTRDNGYQVLRSCLRIRPETAQGHATPVRLRKGTLGRGAPDRALRTAPAQRLLIGGPGQGQPELLVEASRLCTLPGVARLPGPGAGVIQLLFDRHELIMANGAWTESRPPSGSSARGLARPVIRDSDLRALCLGKRSGAG